MSELQASGISVEPKSGKCFSNKNQSSNVTIEAFNKNILAVSYQFKIVQNKDRWKLKKTFNLPQKLGGNDTFEYWSEKGMITYKAEIELEILENGLLEPLATWTRNEKIREAENKKILPAKRFFRIGITPVINKQISFNFIVNL